MHDPSMIQRRRDLRQLSTRSEYLLWQQLRGRGVNGCKARRQVSIGPYVVDFYFPSRRLIIELDGDSHFQPGAFERDARHQKYFEQLGFCVTRFTDREIFDSLASVVEIIGNHLVARTPPTAPPQGGGE